MYDQLTSLVRLSVVLFSMMDGRGEVRLNVDNGLDLVKICENRRDYHTKQLIMMKSRSESVWKRCMVPA
jgi:hypothetical protein